MATNNLEEKFEKEKFYVSFPLQLPHESDEEYSKDLKNYSETIN